MFDRVEQALARVRLLAFDVVRHWVAALRDECDLLAEAAGECEAGDALGLAHAVEGGGVEIVDAKLDCDGGQQRACEKRGDVGSMMVPPAALGGGRWRRSLTRTVNDLDGVGVVPCAHQRAAAEGGV